MNINSNTRDNNFTFMRLVAAGMVVFGHSFNLLHTQEPVGKMLHIPSHGLGVATFFVISGFLIAASIVRSNTIQQYIKSRCYRIMPALIVSLFVTVFIIGPLITTYSLSAYFGNPKSWAYLNNIALFHLRSDLPGVFHNNPLPNLVNGSLWTLPVEFSAYILLIVFKKFKLIKPIYLLIAALAFVTFHILFFKSYQSLWIFHSLQAIQASKCLAFFFFGSFLFSISDKIKISYYYYFLAWAVFIYGSTTSTPVYFQFLALPYIIIATAYLPIPKINRLDKLGDISYGTYLYAFPVQQTIICYAGGNITPLRLILYALPISMLLGFLSWILVEKPAIKLKGQKLFRRRQVFWKADALEWEIEKIGEQ